MAPVYQASQFSKIPVLIAALSAAFVVGLGIAFETLTWFHTIFIVILAIVLAFSRLTVSVHERSVTAAFGLGWPAKTVDLTDVVDTRMVVNSWWYGFGIRKVPNGWMYNISGLDAVELDLREGKVFRIGTAEPEALLAAIDLQRSVW